jgi:hypothetical protein
VIGETVCVGVPLDIFPPILDEPMRQPPLSLAHLVDKIEFVLQHSHQIVDILPIGLGVPIGLELQKKERDEGHDGDGADDLESFWRDGRDVERIGGEEEGRERNAHSAFASGRNVVPKFLVFGCVSGRKEEQVSLVPQNEEFEDVISRPRKTVCEY